MTGKTVFIWVLRVYILKEPYWAEPTPGIIRYANLKENISLNGIKPVLSDSRLKKNKSLPPHREECLMSTPEKTEA